MSKLIRVRYSHFVPKALGVRAIVLYPYVLFAEPEGQVPLSVIQHEMIHVRQVRSEGWLKFYVNYLFEYFKALVKLRGNHFRAYLAISYEAEAYKGERTTALNEDERREFFGERKLTSKS